MESVCGLANWQTGRQKDRWPAKKNVSPKIFINPVIEKRAKEKLTTEEGCLSCPNKFVDVRRPIYVGLKWTCRHGKEQYKTFYHLPARVVQLEMDHLEGKLCIDYGSK